MARLAYPDASDVAGVMREFPPPLRNMNIGRMVSHAPTLVGPYYNTYAAALQRLELDPKLRQLAILRVAERESAPYVLAQHRALARLAGLTDEQIAATGQPSIESDCFTYVQRLVLAFTDEVIDGPQVSGVRFERIHNVLTPREIVELLLVIGWYWTACRLTTAIDIEPEHPLGHGVIAMLQFEQDRRAGRLAGATPADGAAAVPPLEYHVY
jgi:4-carboxymuconolactone decarboxylase